MATYVLIPGAGGDPWQFHRIVPELEARGHEVVPVTLPAGDDGAGWREYADAVVTAVGDRSGLILVAQSLAGFSAPLVCERLPVDLLVLLNAMIPTPGETGNAWWSNTRLSADARAYRTSIGISPDTFDDDIIYFHDIPPAIVALGKARGEPEQTNTPMEQPWPLAAWPDVPTRVLIGRDDRLFPAAFQHRIARERLEIDGDEIPGGHMASLSYPRELVEQLEAYRAEL